MKLPSDKQLQILDFIKEFSDEKGYPPSVREIGSAVGLKSPSTVHSHIKKLQELGLLRKEDHCTRSLTLPGRDSKKKRGDGSGDGSDEQPGENQIPILGRVTAGMPILAVEECEGYLTTDTSTLRGMHFALKIRGDSMINAGILDGDYIIVRQQRFAESGQIVVALLDDEATCKRIIREGNHVWLMPENRAYRPIQGDHSVILGVVVRVIRDY